MAIHPRAAPPNVAEILNTFRADMEKMFQGIATIGLDAPRIKALRDEYEQAARKLERLALERYNPPKSEAQ